MAQLRQKDRLMTLDEINKAYNMQPIGDTGSTNRADSGSGTQCTSFFRILSDILFYLVVAVILFSVLSVDLGSGRAISIMGYSCFTVMSSSMKSEIPKGSLIITKDTAPGQLSVGDNITYEHLGTAITHKIISIVHNADDPDMTRFQTKGTNNANRDDYTVYGSDVLGKVIFVLPKAGDAINLIADNLYILLPAFIICSIVSFLLRGAGKRKDRRIK